MLKIVVLDGGFGGEIFADRLEEELPIANIIRVIDWRNADLFLKSSKSARQVADAAIRPYIGRVDLIIFANHLVSITSLKYFRRKYQNQKFLGLKLPTPNTPSNRPTVILTTKAVTHTINYYNYIFRLKRKSTTVCLDTWSRLIDDGELTEEMIGSEMTNFRGEGNFRPPEMVLACSQFNDIIPIVRKIFDYNIKIYDSFDSTIQEVFKTLKIRGGTGKKKS